MLQSVEAEGFQCVKCVHLDEKEFKCAAYPVRIPDIILYGYVQHNEVLPDQEGDIIFEQSK